MKYGFEKELFVLNEAGEYALATSLPHDDCGYLAEARGEPHQNPLMAAALMDGAEVALRADAKRLALSLVTRDYVTLPRAFAQSCLRRFGKNASQERSLYGRYIIGPLAHAGLHVHFSNEVEAYAQNYNHPNEYLERRYAGLIDMPRFIVGLDRRFAKEIKAARRVPGLYEMKPYGFEYRSLPASIDPYEVAGAISKIA